MNEKEQYTALISEIIKKQSLILGPEIAVLKARSVPGLMVDNDGKVTGVGESRGRKMFSWSTSGSKNCKAVFAARSRHQNWYVTRRS